MLAKESRVQFNNLDSKKVFRKLKKNYLCSERMTNVFTAIVFRKGGASQNLADVNTYWQTQYCFYIIKPRTKFEFCNDQ